MPNWSELLDEFYADRSPEHLTNMRMRYLHKLYELTGRNVIAYYSGFLQRPDIEQISIKDNDKNGFMTVINKMDRSKGLDLVLHTPGGDLAAAESIIEYMRLMFGNDIRVMIPQIAMSAGTIMACAGKEIIMGKQSNIGPIDPQFRGIPASGVVEEFERAMDEVTRFPRRVPIWQEIIKKYHPTFIGECEKAIKWSKQVVTDLLIGNMLLNDTDAVEKVEKIVNYLSDHSETMSHDRHIGIEACEKIGLKVLRMEDDSDMQECALSAHHTYMITLANTNTIKIIENHMGVAMMQNI